MAETIHVMPRAVVLYRRSHSGRWQARLKLADKTWRRVSTKEYDPLLAGKAAMKLYYDAEFKREHKLPQNTRRFSAVADAVVTDLKAQLEAGTGKVVYHSYVGAITNYLKPFFGKHNVDSITPVLLNKFGQWREQRMGKKPVASTITNHNSALNAVFKHAMERGWVSLHQLPKLVNEGRKSSARPAFTLNEYRSMVQKLRHWATQGRTAKTREMRELLRDYVLILANTGIRHGTEAQSLRWRNIEWIEKDRQRFLRLSVSGKIGMRSLIARVNTEDYLKRIQSRFPSLAKMTFDQLLAKRVDEPVFRLADGSVTGNLNQSFSQFMRDSGMAVGGASDKERTLYSLRHTYATFALADGIGIHELARQMGTSVSMLEQHYSKITPELLAHKFAGRPHMPRDAAKKKAATKKKTTAARKKAAATKRTA